MQGTIGEIRLFVNGYVPKGWALCHGQILSISQHQSLFSILGTKYGGDGRVNFALPALHQTAFGDHFITVDPGVDYIICIEGDYPEFN
jgi:microcystin-dependent protein